MKIFNTFWVLLALLIGFGGWGISLLIKDSSRGQNLKIIDSLNHAVNTSVSGGSLDGESQANRSDAINKVGHNKSATLPKNSKQYQPAEASLVASANQLLYSEDVDSLVLFINEHYSDLSSESLTTLRVNIRRQAISLNSKAATSSALKLFSALAQVFDDLPAWRDLSQYAVAQEQWEIAFSSTLKTSLLENDGTNLTELLKNLATIAQNHANQLIAQGDTLGTSEIFEVLYLSHPGHPRFQFDYANSLLALARVDEAKTLFSQLLSDTEFAILSREALAKINADSVDNSPQRLAKDPPRDQDPDRSSIKIPLIPYGTSFLINTRINGRPITLLLDTGASITSLDSSVIERLRLPTTGQSITLSTANGRTRSKLYTAKSVDLGGINVNGQTIAGIDLGSNPRFSGLLGTDILNNQTPQYAFILDTQNQVLIFRQR